PHVVAGRVLGAGDGGVRVRDREARGRLPLPHGERVAGAERGELDLVAGTQPDPVRVEARVEGGALDPLQLALRRRATEDGLGRRIGGGGEQQRAEQAGRGQVANPHDGRIYGRPVQWARGLSGGKRCGYPACRETRKMTRRPNGPPWYTGFPL